MTDVAIPPLPTTPSAPPSLPTAPAPLKPGWQTSEAWVTLLTMIIGVIPSSGLTDNAPLLAKIVGMAIAALAALHYTAQRTALKRAHLAAFGAAPTQISKVPLAVSAALVALVVALVSFHGCAGSAGSGAIAAGGSAFLQCSKQDLTQLVGPQGWTLLATVYDDLAKDDYGKLITDLITTVGSDAVGCAVVAIDSIGKTSGNGSGSGSRALTPLETRAKELITKYSWKIATTAAPPTAK